MAIWMPLMPEGRLLLVRTMNQLRCAAMERCLHTDTVHTSSTLRVTVAGLDGGESERPFRPLLAAQCCPKGSHLFMHTRQGSGCMSALVLNMESKTHALCSTPCVLASAYICLSWQTGRVLANWIAEGSAGAVHSHC